MVGFQKTNYGINLDPVLETPAPNPMFISPLAWSYV